MLQFGTTISPSGQVSLSGVWTAHCTMGPQSHISTSVRSGQIFTVTSRLQIEAASEGPPQGHLQGIMEVQGSDLRPRSSWGAHCASQFNMSPFQPRFLSYFQTSTNSGSLAHFFRANPILPFGVCLHPEVQLVASPVWPCMALYGQTCM